MLSHIHIRNFAIIDEVDVEFDAGMTALTGETGAGKSILVDALGLLLGDRADSGVIRHGCDRAEISAGFDIGSQAAVTAWLGERELDMDGECQLRRVINRTGRTRGYINGQPAPMQSLRELGEMLVDIHGQHEHQSLLRGSVQRQLLDDFGGHHALLKKVAGIHREGDTRQLRLSDDTTLETDRILVATGRRPVLHGLGLESAGVEYNQQGITVDRRLRTSQKHIYAVGDVCGPYPFTHMAEYQAGIALAKIVFRIPRKTDYRVIPQVV